MRKICHRKLQRCNDKVYPFMAHPTLSDTTALLHKAADFLRLFYHETKPAAAQPLSERLREVEADIVHTGSYVHTFDELQFGARVAWRNSGKCIGRLYWNALVLRDYRSARTPEEIQAALLSHIEVAQNQGHITPCITVFRPATLDPDQRIVIHNSQLIGYAGYRHTDGSFTGDPKNANITELCQSMGWRGTGSRFDLLPVVFQVGQAAPQLFELPPGAVIEVPLTHPDLPWFAELGLKWYALPAISNMPLEVGGLIYTAAPFSGWYMGTEIGARDLADCDRYNQLPIIARHMGLDTSSRKTLWQDRALIELNHAVLYSFARQGVRIVDHHTASQHFLTFMRQEEARGRSVNADWSWIVPPISAAATEVFHLSLHDEPRSPGFLAPVAPL